MSIVPVWGVCANKGARATDELHQDTSRVNTCVTSLSSNDNSTDSSYVQVNWSHLFPGPFDAPLMC